MKALVLAIAILALATTAAYSALNTSSTAEAAGISVEPFIWQFDEDYPDGTPADDAAPIDTVYIKTHDATDWMSRWDHDPKAINGTDAIRREVERYQALGIRTIAWFVPRGHDYEKQVNYAKAVLDTGVDALYADVEPYQGFCWNDCQALAENLWKPLRAERPDAVLGVIYDPRPLHWEKSGLATWMSVADAALPMCYWDAFVDQPPWNDPRGCITTAAADLQKIAPGRDLDYVPIVQGNTSPEKMLTGIDAVYEVGGSRMSIWRRGEVTHEIWATIESAQQYPSPAAMRRSLEEQIAVLRAINPRTMEQSTQLVKLIERAEEMGLVII